MPFKSSNMIGVKVAELGKTRPSVSGLVAVSPVSSREHVDRNCSREICFESGAGSSGNLEYFGAPALPSGLEPIVHSTREWLQAIPAAGLGLGPTGFRHRRKPCTGR